LPNSNFYVINLNHLTLNKTFDFNRPEREILAISLILYGSLADHEIKCYTIKKFISMIISMHYRNKVMQRNF